MADKEKDKQKKKNNAPIENLVKSVISQRDTMYRKTYGTGDVILRELDKDLNIISSILNDFIEEKEKSNGNIVNQIGRYTDKKYREQSQQFSEINRLLGDRDNLDIVSAMYMELKPRLELYKDFETLYELIPQLKDAVWTIRDNILSPDDFSKFILNITYDDSNTAMTSLVNKVKKDYKLDKKAKKVIEKTLIYGEQYIAPISYKTAFNKILTDKHDKNTFRKVSESSLKEIDTNEWRSHAKGDQIIKSWNDTCHHIQLCEGIESIDTAPLTDMYHFFNESKTGNSLKANSSYKIAKKIGTPDGTIDQKNVDVDVTGSYVKFLDIKKIIPININDTCLGYYYIEIGDELLDDSTLMSLGNVSRISLKNTFVNTDMRDQMYGSLSEVIYNNLDKKFIENNKNIKKFIYEMVQYHDAINKPIKIVYLQPEEVVCFKINEDENGRGRGIFYDILFVAKIYLSLMITNTMLRLTRKPDKRVYYIRQGINQEVGRSIQNAVIQLKKDQGSIYDINHISRIMSYTGRFSDLFVPVTDNGEKPIDFDVMAGQDIEVKDEFLDTMERIMVNGTGVPNALYNNYASEVDYARTLAMANGRFIRLIVSYQFDFEEPLTETVQKLCDQEINTDSINENNSYNIDSIKVTLPSPTTLNLTNSIDLFNNVNQMVEHIIQTMGLDENDTKLISLVKKRLVQRFMPNIEWEQIEKLIKQAEVDSAIESQKPSTNEGI